MAGLLAVVLLGSGIGWAAMTQRSTPPIQTDVDSPAPTTSATPSAGPIGEQDVEWIPLGGLPLPISRVDGPRCRANGLASCFSRTPRGAAFAAVNLLVRTFPFAGSKVFTPTIRDQVTGRHTRALFRLTGQAYRQTAQVAGIRDGAPIPSEGGWIAGYQLTTGNTAPAPDHTTVRVLLRQDGEGSQVGFVEYSVSLVWRAGDWRLIAPAWGDWRSSARALSSADPRSYRSFDQAGGRP